MDYKIINEYTYNTGYEFRAEDGTPYRVIEKLGKGGQGEVYKVIGNDGTYALKWYYKERYLDRINAVAFKKNLLSNIQDGVPRLSSGEAADQFIWPLKMVMERDRSFGYLMRLFPQGYDTLKSVILGRKKETGTGKTTVLTWGSWFARITAALNIVRAFEILHAKGFSYQDVNDGGFCLNMNTGEVFICDCDNVSPDKTNLGILGIKTFMAPEVVRGESLPDRHTDEYSLAIILFRLFFHGHPMIGQESRSLRSSLTCSDAEIDTMIYGTKPHYCLASKDNENPIDPKRDRDVFRLALTYPVKLMDAFEQVFTEGAYDPMRRLNATEWRKILLSVRDHLIIKEGKEEFYGRRINTDLPVECRTLSYKRGRKVLCMPGKILYGYHFDEYSADYRNAVGKIICTNKNGVIGLHNQSGKNIDFTLNGKSGTCRDGGRLPLLVGMTIKTGGTCITVE